MSNLFDLNFYKGYEYHSDINEIWKNPNNDISDWNVSNVTNMENMFWHSEFNPDISKWDTPNVTNMSFMFVKSKFNQYISNWDVSRVVNMCSVFYGSILCSVWRFSFIFE